MNIPSFYQEDLFRALVATGEVDLQVIFARGLPPDRQQLGWHNDTAGYKSLFLNTSDVTHSYPISDVMSLAWRQRHRLHIINGIWAEPTFSAALVVLAATRSQYVIYSEAPNPHRSRAAVKRLLRNIFGRIIVRRAVGLLAVAQLGVDFYRSLGAREEQIYPFGYFRSHPELLAKRPEFKNSKQAELIFVGQLVHRKGIDFLLEAITPLILKDKHLILSLIGDGEERVNLQNQANALGIGNQVHFDGVLPASQIPARIRHADMLVLPSRWDGWGLVVNEALSVGVPAIVSDKCGASELIQPDSNGYVFRSEDVTDLRQKLESFLKRKEDRQLFGLHAAKTGEMISTKRAACYLISCLEHMLALNNVRPCPPWYS